ncbi:MAG TPA: RHS repeat-associated core domain-containing protein [Actinoplanes sp.]
MAGRADAAELVRATLPGGGILAYAAAGARPVPGVAVGNTARYAGVWNDVDLELQAQPGGVEETLVLASPKAPRVFVFPLALTGLTASMDGRSVVLTDNAGVRRATIPAGYMVDADQATSDGVTYRLFRHLGSAALEVRVDDDWLDDSARTFPVRVDPPVVAHGSATQSMVVQGSSSHAGGQELLIGRKDGVSAASYLKFPGLVEDLKFHTILGAQLSVVNFDSASCKPRAVGVHPVTGAWQQGDAKSYPGPAVGAALSTQSFAQGYVGVGQSASSCPVTGNVFNLGARGRDLIQGWVDGKANNGLSLRAPVNDESAWKKFTGTATANPPRLSVTHSPYNATYVVPDPMPRPAVLQNQAGKVKFIVTNKSAMDWKAGEYQLIYRLYDSKTAAAKGQFVAAKLTGTVPRVGTVTLEATINALPIGQYWLDFSMAKVNGPVFTDENVRPVRLSLQVDNIAPVVGNLYPPNGYQSPTLAPQLWAQATDLDAPPKTSLQFKFEYCRTDDKGAPVGCTVTPYQSKQAFTVPTGAFAWSKTYVWRAFVKDNATEVTTPYSTLTTTVPQPEITSRIANAAYGSQERDFDPNVGNYSTGAVDASVNTVGPPLKIARTYNSLDPRRDLMFGAGWMTQMDMRLQFDQDGSGNALVTYPDGQQVRFGRNADGTFAAPLGRTANLLVTGATYTLLDAAGTKYEFASSGRIRWIIDKWSRALAFTSDPQSGQLAMVQALKSKNGTVGRSLRFGWTGGHVTSVSTDPVDGAPLTWTYAYTGDLLTTVCAPAATKCMSYSYAPGSHYRSGVMDSDPDSYWRFDEPAGAVAAGSEVANNLGRDAAALRNVTLGAPGLLPGTGNTAASFNGQTSVVELPRGIVKRNRDSAVELRFKISRTETGGPLLGYQDGALDGSPTVGVPLLYVGLDGRLRGQFRTTAATPKPIEALPDVRDDKWHHVVLSVTADTQTLYLDGAKVGTKNAGTDGVLDHSLLTYNQVGAGYASNPTAWTGWGTSARRTFNGSIDEVAVYGHAISEQTAALHTALQRTAADQLSAVVLPSGKTASETVYDTDTDRVKEYTDGNGGTWQIGAPHVYGGATDLRRAIQVLDPADRPYLYEYDALGGWMLRSGTPVGQTTRPEDLPGANDPKPSPSPSPTKVCTSPDPGDPQFCTTIPGDAGGPVFTEQQAAGMVVRSFFYNAQGQQERVVNEIGSDLKLAFDARGNVTSRTTCRQTGSCNTAYTAYTTPSATNPFDPRNDLPTDVRDARSSGPSDNEFKTTTAYNGLGEVERETGPDQASTITTYTDGLETAVGSTSEAMPAGLVRSVKDTEGRTTRYRYNVHGDLAEVISPSGLSNFYTYDSLGRRKQDREVSDSFPVGVVTTYTYDGQNRLTNTTGPVTTDEINNVTHKSLAVTTYDEDSNVVKVELSDTQTDEPHRITITEYDEFNRVTRTVNAEGDEQTQGWDRFGNRVSVVDGNGNHYEYAYTARNQLAEVRLYDWHGDPPGAGAPPGPNGEYVVLNAYAYDLAGRMIAQVDSMGRRLEYTYFGDDLLKSVVLKDFHNPDGTTRDFLLEENTYDKAGNLLVKLTGNRTETNQNKVNAMGRIETATVDPGGLNRRRTFTYDTLGNIRSTVQAGNASNVPWALPADSRNTFENVYDEFGRVFQEKVVDGTATRVTSYTFDQRGLTLSATDPRGSVGGADKAAYTATYRYDEKGNRVASTAPPVNAERGGGPAQVTRPTVITGYNAFGEVVATKDALGNVARTTYDRLGRVVLRTGPVYVPPSGPATGASPITKTVYDALDNPIEVTDARGNVTKYTYDRLNRVTVRDEPALNNDQRAVWRYTYTRTGKMLSSTSPTGVRNEMTYDDLDRPVTSTKVERKPVADTFTTTMAYDDAGNMVSTTSPSHATTTMTYNKVGELLTSTDPAKVMTRQGYDGFGSVVRISDGNGLTIRRDYDGFGQLKVESDLSPSLVPLRTEEFGYDAAGNVISRTNALKKTVTFDYNALNQLTRQVEPKSATESITTTFGYDAAGNRTRYTDGRKNSTYFGVNSLGRPETVIEPPTTAHPGLADRTWVVDYDLNGNARQLLAPGGVTRVRTFDAANRLRTETGTGAGTAVDRGMGYDLDGRVTSITASGRTNVYDYNDRGGLLTATGPSGNAAFTYNDDGQVDGRTDAAGSATFGYQSGRLHTMKDGATAVTQTLAYNGGGQLETIDYGAGRVRTYGYDEFGRTKSDVLKNSAGAEIAKVIYRYDLDDHLAGKDTTGTAGAGSNTYDFDDAGRMISWTSAAGKVEYGWDDSGNRIRAGAKTATYDERNRLLSDSDYTYGYTPRGTMATRTSSGLTEQFSFDAFDRLIGSKGQNYIYDGLDRVVNRNGALFGYAGFEQDPVNDGTQTFARGPGGELLGVALGSDAQLALSDEHSDVVGGFSADGALTALESSTAYDPYGRKTATSGTRSNVGFQGDWTDPSTGQVNMGARWYEPTTGGFLSRDSVNYSKGDSILANRYTYGAGDPVSNSDPDGHWPSCGWCKRAVSNVSSALHTVGSAIASSSSWLYSQASAGLSAIARAGINTVKAAWNGVKSAYYATRAAYNRYVAPTAKRAADYARQRAAAVYREAVRVRDNAKAAISTAAKRVPLTRLAQAAVPILAGLSKVSMSAVLPAKLVASFNTVVQDTAKAAQQLYQKAVELNGAMLDGMQAASDWVVDHKAAIAGFIAGAVVGVGCGIAIGWTGVGAVGCAALAGAAGSLVNDLVEGGKGWKEMSVNALMGATIGAVTGPLSSIGGSALTAGVRGLVGGGVREAISVGGSAAANTARSFGNRQVGGLVGRALEGRAASGSTREMAEEAGSCLVTPKPNSFAPGTAVLMADRSTKKIEDVKVGDMVLATDPTTGKTESREVTDLIVGYGEKQMVKLTVDVDGADGEKTGAIRTTDGHPFWVADRHEWIDAGDVEPDAMLRTSAGTYVQVKAVAKWTARGQRVHNLTVDGLHTYYAMAGNAPVLVHNCDTDYRDVALGLRKHGLRQAADDNGYTHFLDDTRDAALANVRDVANNHPNAIIHVRMDGFRMTNGRSSASPAELFEDAYREGGGDNWFTTQREMNILGRAVRLGNRDWNSIKFTRNGEDAGFPLPGFLGG